VTGRTGAGGCSRGIDGEHGVRLGGRGSLGPRAASASGAPVRTRMPVIPVVAGAGSRCCAQQVVQYVDNCADVAFGPAVAVLERGVQGAAERPRVHALAVVVHALDDRALAPLRVLLRIDEREVGYKFWRPSVSGWGCDNESCVVGTSEESCLSFWVRLREASTRALVSRVAVGLVAGSAPTTSGLPSRPVVVVVVVVVVVGAGVPVAAQASVQGLDVCVAMASGRGAPNSAPVHDFFFGDFEQ
jgi:hypothetical protein